MGIYNQNAGKWRNYIIKPQTLGVLGSGGKTGSPYGGMATTGQRLVKALAMNDSKVEVKYDINIVPALMGTDEYQWRYSIDDGSTWSAWKNAAGAGTEYKMADSDWGYLSLDEGVSIQFVNHAEWLEAGGAEYDIKFTTPSFETYRENRIYINGWATSLDFSSLSEEDGGGEGEGQFSDHVELKGSSYTAIMNYDGAAWESVAVGNNYRLSIEVWGSMDGTNYFELDKIFYDVDTHEGAIETGIFDKEDSDQGGKARYYKFRATMPDEAGGGGTGSLKASSANQYMQFALIKNY